LVIVDEASQSDLWALPAILRGKWILVVGDDKQVSPDGGFIESMPGRSECRTFNHTTSSILVDLLPSIRHIISKSQRET
jgi:superfamily I DNA and/or RNA helicase